MNTITLKTYNLQTWEGIQECVRDERRYYAEQEQIRREERQRLLESLRVVIPIQNVFRRVFAHLY